MGVDLCHVAHSLGPALPEHHVRAGAEVLWVLVEAEAAGSLVSRAQVLLVHGDDGGRLSQAATVNCIDRERDRETGGGGRMGAKAT